MGHNTNTRSSRPNPLLLIGIGAVVFIAIVALIIPVLSQKSEDDSSDSQSQSQPYGDYKKEFNQFANYIISNKASDEQLVGEYDATKSYALNLALRSDDAEKRSTFLKQAKDYLDRFYHDFSLLKSVNYAVKERTSSYRDSWLLIWAFFNEKWFTDDELLALFNDEGSEKALAKVDKAYSDSINLDSGVVEEYVETKKAYDRLILARYDRYSRNGCITKGIVDESCVLELAPNASNGTISETRSELNRQYSVAVLSAVGSIWDISELVNNLEEE